MVKQVGRIVAIVIIMCPVSSYTEDLVEGDDDDVEEGRGDVEAGGQDLSDSDNNNNDRCDAFQMLGAFWRLRGDWYFGQTTTACPTAVK